METKKCPKCGFEKDIGCFHAYFSQSRNKYRVGNYCKECAKKSSNIRAKNHYLENREEKLKYAANYRENNKEKISNKRNFYRRKHRYNLQDCYVRELLVTRHNFTIEILDSNPELIESRRLIIRIKRSLKKIKEDGK